jgi:DNA repair protein RadD
MLRPYQQRTIAAVRDAVQSGKRAPCVVVPTGGGKTVIASTIAREAVDAGKRVVWLAHREELIDQAARTFSRASILRADDPRVDPDALISIASIPTLIARGTRPSAELVIIDECHHVTAASWRSVADHYSHAIRIGLTATPERSDGSPLGDVFDHLIVGANYSELIRDGYLVDADVVAPPRRMRGAVADSPSAALLRHLHDGRSALVFTSSVAESIACVNELRGAGIAAAHVDGDTRDRSRIVDAFRSGAVSVLSSCAVLTEGFDAPRAKIAVLARSCSSPLTYLQIVGRVLRPDQSAPSTRALVIDLVGAVHEHGWPTDDRSYSLDGIPIRRASADKLVIWQCPACGHCQQHAPASRICPRCGATMPEPKPLRIERLRLERQRRNAAASVADQRAALVRLVALARERGYSVGWAMHVFHARYHRWPTREERAHATRV